MLSLTRSQRHGLVGLLLVAPAGLGLYVLFNTFDGKGYDYSPRWNGSDGLLKPPSVSPDQKQVTLTYLGGACDDHATADVDESSERVKIAIRVTENGDYDCSAMGVARTISVNLSEPLDGRALVDGGTEWAG